MDLRLSEEQEMLRQMAHDFLLDKCPKTLVREIEEDEKGHPVQLWKEVADLGWMGLALPEKYNGGGMNFLDLSILVEEMGRACMPGPFLSTVVLGALPILDFGNDEHKERYLPDIAGGRTIFTLALTEMSAQYDVASITAKAEKGNENYVINGTKLFVPYAHIADHLLCVARTGDQSEAENGVTMFIVDAKSPGISCNLLKSISGERLCEVVFDNVEVPGENIVGEVDQGWNAVQKIIERAAVAKCCEMIGGVQQVLEMTVDYAKERKQFARPIGSFQAIKHYCADMAVAVDGVRFATYQAAWRLSEGLPCRKEVAVAKAGVNDTCKRVVALAHQIHGAIGMTIDHDLQFYTRRLRASESTFGDSDFYREVMAREMGL